jgi:hypothetical protein
LLAVGFAVGFFPGRATRGWQIRRYLIELARYDDWGLHHEHPSGRELQRYAVLLGEHHDPQEYVGQELTGKANRFWKQREVRLA